MACVVHTLVLTLEQYVTKVIFESFNIIKRISTFKLDIELIVFEFLFYHKEPNRLILPKILQYLQKTPYVEIEIFSE